MLKKQLGRQIWSKLNAAFILYFSEGMHWKFCPEGWVSVKSSWPESSRKTWGYIKRFWKILVAMGRCIWEWWNIHALEFALLKISLIDHMALLRAHHGACCCLPMWLMAQGNVYHRHIYRNRLIAPQANRLPGSTHSHECVCSADVRECNICYWVDHRWSKSVWNHLLDQCCPLSDITGLKSSLLIFIVLLSNILWLLFSE